MHESDDLPKMVCESCLYKLNLLSEFREKSILTEKILLDLLKDMNTGKQQMDVVAMDHDLMMAQNQQLLVNHGMGVDEIDLGQLGPREQLIVGHEIILTHQSVDMNGHALDNINLNHHELNQEISNHSLPAQDAILVESESARFGSDNLDLIPHQQLLSEQFRLQHELHVNMGDENAVDEIAMAGGLDGSVVHSKVKKFRVYLVAYLFYFRWMKVFSTTTATTFTTRKSTTTDPPASSTVTSAT